MPGEEDEKDEGFNPLKGLARQPGKALQRAKDAANSVKDAAGKGPSNAVKTVKKVGKSVVDETKGSFRDTKRMLGLKKGGVVSGKREGSGAKLTRAFEKMRPKE